LTQEAADASGGIGAVHAAIAGRVFKAIPGSAPMRAWHDAVARTSYFGVSAGITLAGAVGAAFADGDVHPQVLAAVNALRGDVLEPPLAIEMTAELPSAERLVVFVHGLGETEHAWGREPYAAPGWTAAYIRYNTGRPVADNGATLARLLAVCDAREIALVGHSMGGLVIHSALRQGGADRVTTTVSLGTPHLGAPLAQAVHAAAAGLDLLPETRPFGNLLNGRSAGIRDLRRGTGDRLAPGIKHCFVAATVRHPFGRLVGDALVMPASASGRPFHEGLDLGDTHHLALLNHPQVRERLVRWLA
jgi:pimeloyl-ACP methyl ester carboxylesterase